MIQEIKKEVEGNIENLTQKTRKLTVKLVSFVISCWLVIGTIGIGLVVPVQVARSVMKIDWIKEAKAAETVKPPQRGTTSSRAKVNRYLNIRDYGNTSNVKRQVQPTLKNDLRNTRNAISEFRSLANGLRSLATR